MRTSLRKIPSDRDKKGNRNRVWDETKPDSERKKGKTDRWIYTRPTPTKKDN